MTIEELYGKVLADDELKTSLAEAVKAGKVAEWASAQGVEATEEERLPTRRQLRQKAMSLRTRTSRRSQAADTGRAFCPPSSLGIATWETSCCDGACQGDDLRGCVSGGRGL